MILRGDPTNTPAKPKTLVTGIPVGECIEAAVEEAAVEEASFEVAAFAIAASAPVDAVQ